MKTITLDQIVRSVIGRRGDSSLRRYQTYLQMAVDGYRWMNLYGGNAQIVKTVSLDMLPNKAANLPMDYVKYLKIGVCINGRIITLGLDDSLCLGENYSECGDPLEVAVTNVDNPDYPYFQYGYPFTGYYQNNQFVNSMFGVGGGFNSQGYYKINTETNQIQFASIVPDASFIMEYISDGMNPDGSAAVPIMAKEFLTNWINWKIAENDPKSTEARILRLERRTNIEFRNCKHFELSFTMDEYLDAFRSNIQQTPKR